MIVYAENKVAYKLWDPESRKVVISRDVLFAEDEHTKTDVEDESASDSRSEVDLNDESDNRLGPITSIDDGNEEESSDKSAEILVENPSPENPSQEQINEQPLEEPPEEQTVRRSTRVRRAPGSWWSSGLTALATLPEDDIPDQFLTYDQGTKGENRSK